MNVGVDNWDFSPVEWGYLCKIMGVSADNKPLIPGEHMPEESVTKPSVHPHKWETVSSDAGGLNIEKCTTCGTQCCVDPEMPSRRWDIDGFSARRRVAINPDCNEELVRRIIIE